MNSAPWLFYVVAAVAYAWHFTKRSAEVGKVATILLVAACLVHTFIIGMQTTEAGHLPLVGTTGAVSVFVWLASLAYLYTETTSNERSMGVFIVPLLAVLQTIPAFSNYQVTTRPPVLRAPGSCCSLVSAVRLRELRPGLRHRRDLCPPLQGAQGEAYRLFLRPTASLQVLDAMNARAVTIGWLFLTVGVVVGGVWASQAQAEFSDPRVQAMSLLDPKIFVALLCWLVYSFELYARRAIGWAGWRDGLAVDHRVRHRPAELLAGRVFPDSQSQLLVSCNSDSRHISRSAAPGWQGATREHIGNV